MATQVSPGVDFQEIDQTNTVPALSTAIGGYAGHLNWGPVEELVTVASEKDLAKSFGTPVNGVNARSFLTAASFLKYSNSLRISRAIGAGALNAANANQTLIKNKDHFDNLSSYNFIVSARYPGAFGNSISVQYAYVSGETPSNIYNVWPYRTLFDSPPNQSITAANSGITSNDEIHLVVIDTEGLLSGTKGTVLEKFEGLSLASNAKNFEGASIYYKDVVNENSAYIYIESLSSIFDGADQPITGDSVFGVIAETAATQSGLDLPFILNTSTVVTYPNGSTVTTNASTDVTVTARSGYVGAIGNNVDVIIRSVPDDDVVAKAARGFIFYGVPVNGDTITVNGETFTKAAVAGATDFTNIAELNALVTAVTDINSTVVGGYIVVSAATAGEAGNLLALEVDELNTGTMEVSGSTLKNGVDALSLFDVTVDIPVVNALTGHVTYDVTVSVGNAGATSVTLQNIIDEINIVKVVDQISTVPALSFYSNNEEIIPGTTDAELILDASAILGAGTIEVLSFTEGETVTYDADSFVSALTLGGGSDGTIVPGNVDVALDMFADKDVADIQLLFAEAFLADQEIVDLKVIELANTRRDLLAAISAPLEIASLTSTSDKKAAVIAKFDGIVSTSYVTFSQTPVYTYNRYSDSYVWIPEAGHMMGLCANTDLVAEPWFSPAGFNRGQLKGVAKIAYNPGKTDRDDLYKKRINSIVSLPGEGILLLGDRTAQSKAGAFDRINVRRLFNTVERVIVTASKYQLFELNDEFTRSTFVNLVDPYLRDVQGRRGIIEYRVVCNESNNTPEIIDRNEFVGDIYIKPAKSINYIKLNFIATRTGVEFSEIVG